MKSLFLILVSNLIFSSNIIVDVDSRKISEGESVTLTVQSQNSKEPPIVSISNFEDFTEFPSLSLHKTSLPPILTELDKFKSVATAP